MLVVPEISCTFLEMKFYYRIPTTTTNKQQKLFIRVTGNTYSPTYYSLSVT